MIGESGLGKTRACEVYRNKYPNIEQVERVIKRVIYISLDTSTSLSQFRNTLYEELTGFPQSGRGKNSISLNTIISLLKDLETELILIDEAQHVLTASSNEHGRV